MSKKFRIVKRISMEDVGHFEDIEVDDSFVDKDMEQIIADNEYDPLYDDCESIAVALQLAGYGKVADLEAKLAESEETIIFADKAVKGLNLKIKELEQQLAEKEKAFDLMSIVLCTGARDDLRKQIGQFTLRIQVKEFFLKQAKKELENGTK